MREAESPGDVLVGIPHKPEGNDDPAKDDESQKKSRDSEGILTSRS